ADRQLDASCALGRLDHDLPTLRLTRGARLDRVAQQVEYHLFHQDAVRIHERQRLAQAELEPDGVPARLHLGQAHHLARELVEVESHPPRIVLAREVAQTTDDLARAQRLA